jgi:hypothetical protein
VNESFVQKQVHLVRETQCKELSAHIKTRVPAGVGFILFLCDIGDEGNMAYISTILREDVHKLMWEWLDHEDANHPAEGWQANLLLMSVAEAVGFEGEPEPEALLAHCRKLRRKP